MSQRARVEAVIAAPAERVWDIFRWENLDGAAAAGLFAGVDYEERRAVPGAIRTVHLAGGGSVRERLEEVEEGVLGYRYRVVNLENFPLADYLGSVSVEPIGEAASRIIFACEFVPAGISADEWRALYTLMQQDFIAFVRQRLESRNLEI